jgi:SAM-dependent methyltransferase
LEKDRLKWNRRYRDRAEPGEASGIVVRFCDLARPGPALDIAAGMGKNALYLADRGFSVAAVDVSDVAMNALAGRHPQVSARCRDLDTWDIPKKRYHLIVNTHYLNRRLFPQIIDGLIRGGTLIFETFIHGPSGGPGPTCRDYLLRENELLHGFLALRILHYAEQTEETDEGTLETASLVARKA